MAAEPPKDEHGFWQWLAANRLEALRKVGLKTGQVVVDYGCGAGDFSILAATIVGPDGLVYAVDVDIERLSALRRRADAEGIKNIVTIGVGESAPAARLESLAADVVLLYDVLQMVDDKHALLRRLSDVLKPDGLLSVFPMHIGVEKMTEMASADGLFTRRDSFGMIVNFRKRVRPSVAKKPG